MNAPSASRNPFLKDKWITCNNCRSVLLPLKNYEIAKSTESPGASYSNPMGNHVGYGGSVGAAYGIIDMVLTFITDAITYKARLRKLAKLKEDVLPQHPEALICARCLVVRKQ